MEEYEEPFAVGFPGGDLIALVVGEGDSGAPIKGIAQVGERFAEQAQDLVDELLPRRPLVQNILERIVPNC